MAKIYSVMIKGRTLESRNLRELLARAVSEKRNSDRNLRLSRAGFFAERASSAPVRSAGAL
jgi:hypothetical protein